MATAHDVRIPWSCSGNDLHILMWWPWSYRVVFLHFGWKFNKLNLNIEKGNTHHFTNHFLSLFRKIVKFTKSNQVCLIFPSVNGW